MRVLGIESSCDETAAAVLEGCPGGPFRLLSNCVASQNEVHAAYGGVVPELASRAHIRQILPVIRSALTQADCSLEQLDAVAVTAGPGLVGGLLVGVSAAKGLALASGLPLLGIHHMEGHLVSPLLMEAPGGGVTFPFLALLVSGGHTLLIHARAFGDYQLLGQTLDDAVGEAFDKGARMLELGYPGGPALAALAQGGNESAFDFPRGLRDRPTADFSFSGIKTALRTFLQRQDPGRRAQEDFRRDVAASYQRALVDTLVSKTLLAQQQVRAPRILVAGGVGANTRLRALLGAACVHQGVQPLFPPPALCTDNGAMIALAGLLRHARGDADDISTLNARYRWPLEDLSRARGENAP
ncbi:MAG: tRNA (adenosine(37)-N6)-threonylcarbamoyltransferase complex transferase subunit TsaD [Magnetococcus sp. WYHC-3]